MYVERTRDVLVLVVCVCVGGLLLGKAAANIHHTLNSMEAFIGGEYVD